MHKLSAALDWKPVSPGFQHNNLFAIFYCKNNPVKCHSENIWGFHFCAHVISLISNDITFWPFFGNISFSLQQSVLLRLHACINTPHTHTPTQIFYLSHLVSTFGLWFLWPSVAEVLDNVNQRLVLICVQCIARGTCPINEDSAVGQCTYLKWKWAQLPPLFTNSRRCNGKSPTNFSMWINSKWINIYIYFLRTRHL